MSEQRVQSAVEEMTGKASKEAKLEVFAARRAYFSCEPSSLVSLRWTKPQPFEILISWLLAPVAGGAEVHERLGAQLSCPDVSCCSLKFLEISCNWTTTNAISTSCSNAYRPGRTVVTVVGSYTTVKKSCQQNQACLEFEGPSGKILRIL